MTNSDARVLPIGTPSFSFYLTEPSCKTGSGLEIAQTAARLAGSLTIAGPKGPGRIHRLRALGIDVPILFDREGYRADEAPDPEEWVRTQLDVGGAARALLPGVLLSLDLDNPSEFTRAILEQGRIAEALGAVILVAVEAKVLGEHCDAFIDALGIAGRPVAIVLVDGGDPLALAGAVQGLQRCARQLSDMTLLRSDQGAIGAIACGANHASIGITTTTRHLTTINYPPRGRRDRSQRVFVAQAFDWFVARDIAAWRTTGLVFACDLTCCRGQTLDRFFDPDQDVRLHNMTTLAELAQAIIGADPSQRRELFIDWCIAATQLYGPGRVPNLVKPKPQLESWALS